MPRRVIRHGISVAAVAPFDPASVSWSSLWDSSVTATITESGGAVSQWDDRVAAADLVQGTGSKQPAYQATSGPNSTPCVTFDGSDIMSATISSVSQPWTFVAVAAQTDTGQTHGTLMRSANNNIVDTFGGGSKGHRMYAGAGVIGGASGTGWHLHVCYFNGASSVYQVDGSTVASGDASTTATGTTFYMGNEPGLSEGLIGSIALCGLYSAGDARTDGSWAAFKTWIGTYYGITVA